MKAVIITASAFTLALCLLLSWAFDKLQAESKADVARVEASIPRL